MDDSLNTETISVTTAAFDTESDFDTEYNFDTDYDIATEYGLDTETAFDAETGVNPEAVEETTEPVSFLDFLSTHVALVVILAAIPLAAALLRLFLRRRGARKAEEELTQIKRRDEALADALRNPLVKNAPRSSEDAMEIAWDERAVGRGKRQKNWMIELVEVSGYSRRKYVFHAEETIQIGSASDNRLSLPREGVSRVHCEIFMTNKKPCLRSAPGAKTILHRGREPVLVGPEGVYLHNKDHIQIGTVDIQFRLFRA